MYITWKYDIFPYQLCAKVIKKNKSGFYQVEGYGSMSFKAKTIIKNNSIYISFKNDYLKILLFISRLQRTYSLEEAISSGIMKKPILKK